MNFFLDCGYYVGKAIEYYAPLMDEEWKILAFEPNTELDLEQSIGRFNLNYTLYNKAVWIEDGHVDFWISKNNSASFIDGISDNGPDRKITVESVDFSKLVANLPENSKIVCSMDIEGAEYPVLRKMIKEGTMGRIQLLDIEFHHRFLPNEDAASTQQLIREVQGCGTLVKVKVEV